MAKSLSREEVLHDLEELEKAKRAPILRLTDARVEATTKRAAADEAEAAATRAYAAALADGWTDADLKKLKLDGPAKRPNRGRPAPRARQSAGAPEAAPASTDS